MIDWNTRPQSSHSQNIMRSVEIDNFILKKLMSLESLLIDYKGNKAGGLVPINQI